MKGNKLILLIIALAFAFRIAFLPDNLFFGWEQGRDFLKMGEILSGDFVLVGPKTDIGGVFHGALSYYIPLVPFIVFSGNPFLVLLSYILVTSLSIFLLYRATVELFGKRVGLLSSLFYAVSYSAIIFSRWLSNPNLVPALTIAIFYFLVKARKDWRYLLGVVVAWSIVFHLLVIAALALILPIILFIKLEKLKVSIIKLIIFGVLIVLILSPYLVFELRNNFIMTKSLLEYSSSGSALVSGLGFFDQFINEIVDNIIPFSPRLSFLLFISILVFATRKLDFNKGELLVILFLIAPPVFFLVVGSSPLRHFYITVSVFLSITTALVVDKLLTSSKYKFFGMATILIVLFGNLATYAQRVPENKANFIHHAQRTYLGDQKSLIEWIYSEASGDRFSYDYYTVPYFINDGWRYLFDWYGDSKYGYTPEPTDQRTTPFYVIIEPNEGAPVHLDNWYGEFKKDLELSLAEAQFGKLRVEKRIPKNETEK